MSDEVVILIISNSNLVIPIHIDAFTVADGPKNRINEKYIGSLVLYPDGSVFVIKKIIVKGLYGNSFFSKFFSFLNSNWEIEVRREKIELTFGNLIDCVVSNLNNKSISFFNIDISQAEAIKLVRCVKSVEDLFKVLNVNDNEDFLDVL
jgi:hypothetical protein